MGAAETDVDVETIDPDTAAAARVTAARHATDASDLRMLLAMLGLNDTLGCRSCGDPLPPRRTVSTKRRAPLCPSCQPRRTPPPKRQRTPAPEKPPGPQCSCGRPAGIGGKCARCAQYVPKGDLRLVIERIKRDTGMSTTAIAGRLGMLGTSLRRSISPTGGSPHVRRSTYTAALRLAEELSA